MQLWLCLRLDELALQCLSQPLSQTGAAAVVEQQRLYRVNADAALLGLEPGMDLHSSRSLAGEQALQLLERDPGAEARALDALCCWAYGITPCLHAWRGDSLLLDIGGCLRLFGGIEPILQHCRRGLACRGYSASMGLAPTAVAAWLLAGSEPERALNWQQTLPERLAPLPLQALQPLQENIAGLARSGLQTLGELLALPAAALRRRGGEALHGLLRQLTEGGEPLTERYQPPSCFADSYPLGYPLSDLQELGPAMEALLQSLQAYLRQRQLQTRCIHWHFLGQGRYREQLELRSHGADNDWRDWLRLTRLRLERQPFQEPIECVQLRSDELQAAQPISGELFTTPGRDQPPTRIVDQISARLGPQAVQHLRCRDAHLPEHSSSTSAVNDGAESTGASPVGAQRPLWLLRDPELLAERPPLHHAGKRLELLYGPERIEDGWWQGRPVSRDYYVACTTQGQRLWVFYERRQRRWYLHGIFP